MAINSVGSSTSADALKVGAKTQPEPGKISAGAKREAPVPPVKAAVAPTADKPVETPRPVVNAQGQTTGRIINTRA